MACSSQELLLIRSVKDNAHTPDHGPELALDGVNAWPSNWLSSLNRSENERDDQDGLLPPAGENPWIEFDLGGIQCVQDVGLSFNYLDDGRQYRYEVGYSNDGVSYTFEGGEQASIGESAQGTFEYFDLGGVQASHIRVVSNGNTVNQYFQLNEFHARGDQQVEAPNGYLISISGNGQATQNYDIYGHDGGNSVDITPDPALPIGEYSYTVSTPTGESCGGELRIVSTQEPPEPKDCSVTVLWPGSGLCIKRDCYLENMTDQQAQLATFEVGELPVGIDSASVDVLGNITINPDSSIEPASCESVTRSVQVIVRV